MKVVAVNRFRIPDALLPPNPFRPMPPDIAAKPVTSALADSVLASIDEWLHSKWMGFLTALSGGIDQIGLVAILACIMMIPFVNDGRPKKWAWLIAGGWFILRIILKGAGI